MTSLPEKIIAFFAPHWCMVCSAEDNVLCAACLPDVFVDLPSYCVMCKRPTADWRLCVDCSSKSRLQSVFVAAEYKDLPAELLKRFKYQRLKAASRPLAAALDMTLPYLAPDTLIVPLPTARNRVRQRGYDQAYLLARDLGQIRALSVATPLLRMHDRRQVGANRQTRLQQARNAYTLARPELVRGNDILLVDDICTTGASLAAAAKLLHKAGARSVIGAVVASHQMK